MSVRFDVVLTGGVVVTGDGSPPAVADLGVRAGRVSELGELGASSGAVHVDCSGQTLFPGFVDAHSHAEGSVFDAEAQSALLRQGVTTLVLGQDGVSLAPGPGTYAEGYFGTLNGRHPCYAGPRVRDLLDTYDGAVPVNIAYAVPLGTVRHEVLGHDPAPADPRAVRAMQSLVDEGLVDGAVGASSGLDYVPGRHAGQDELTAVVEPLRDRGGVYVTHMRGGYEENSASGLEEVAAIAAGAGVPVHVSHLHGRRALLEPLLADLAERGVDASFDAYPYRRGFSLLAMPVVPAALLSGPADAVVARLATEECRTRLVEEWFPALMRATGGLFAESRLAHVPAPGDDELTTLAGSTISDAAARLGVSSAELVHEVLVATALGATAVYAGSPHTTDQDWIGLLTHPWHLAGSDGIFLGAVPHPRAWGAFARLLADHTGPGRAYSLDDAAAHLSGRAAARFGLAGRGRLCPGSHADVAVVDLARVRDRATYDDPRAVAEGVDTVLVNGTIVLADGRLTGRNAGRALRRGLQ